MDELALPNHVIDKVERRWAARLARDARTWRSERPVSVASGVVTDGPGRPVPVFRRKPPGGSGAPLPHIAWR